MDLHEEKCRTALVNMTEESWITEAFINMRISSKKQSKIINMIIFQIFIGIIVQEWWFSWERFDMFHIRYEYNQCVTKNEPWITVLGISERKGFSKFSGRGLMEQEGKKGEDITGKVDLQSSKQHFQLHRNERKKENRKGTFKGTWSYGCICNLY